MELNEAILNVITTMRKKDMIVGAFDTVKKAGYIVTYRGGGAFWEVEHPKTYKRVYFTPSKSYYQNDKIRFSNGHDVKAENANKIDFVNYLNTPINSAFYRRYEYEPTKAKIERLDSARWYIKYHTERIEKIKKELASKLKDLEYHAGCLANEETELKNIKKEYKLIK